MITDDKLQKYMGNVKEIKNEIIEIIDKLHIEKRNVDFYNFFEHIWLMKNNSRKAETECFKTIKDNTKRGECRKNVLDTTQIYEIEITNKLQKLCPNLGYKLKK